MDVWRKPLERPNPMEVWPEDHEKSTQNHLDGRNTPPRNSRRPFGGATGAAKPRTGGIRPPTRSAAPATGRGPGQDSSPGESGGRPGHREGWSRADRPRPAEG